MLHWLEDIFCYLVIITGHPTLVVVRSMVLTSRYIDSYLARQFHVQQNIQETSGNSVNLYNLQIQFSTLKVNLTSSKLEQG